MSEFLNRRNETATLWRVTGNNSSGDQQYAAPVQIKVRWEERALVFTNSAGQDEMATAVIWVPYDVFEGEVVALGTFTNADPWVVAGAREIQGFVRITHLIDDSVERRAYLGARRIR